LLTKLLGFPRDLEGTVLLSVHITGRLQPSLTLAFSLGDPQLDHPVMDEVRRNSVVLPGKLHTPLIYLVIVPGVGEKPW